MSRALADAYSRAGAAWSAGPDRIYGRLAEAVIARATVPLHDRSVLDVGAGTGAAGRAALAAGASTVVAVDVALGMLRHDRHRRPPAAVADALALPFPAAGFGAAVAAFSLNHVRSPASGLREMARVVRRGSPVLAAAYLADDGHPVKEAVEGALRDCGWETPGWYQELRDEVIPVLATLDGCRAALAAAGLDGDVVLLRVPFPDVVPPELVRWRLGMAQHAAFFERLPAFEQREVVGAALERLGRDPEPLVRSVGVITATAP